MKIYGVALLAGCYLCGLLVGEVLGKVMGIEGNLGGVGFAMLFLILITDALKKRNKLSAELEGGIGFWTAMYIPIIIAMSSIQNVQAALNSGTLAFTVGILSTFCLFVFVKWMIKVLTKTEEK